MGYDNEEHMPQPDWVRAMVFPDQKRAPVGDPALWGNELRVPIDEALAPPIPFRLVESGQIILAHATDRYTRSWSLSGTVKAPSDVWDDLQTYPPPAFVTPPEGSMPRLSVYLSVLQGVDKVTIEHLICLVYGGDQMNVGLCNQQSTVHGGPYVPRPNGDFTEQTRPFAAIGSLIGNTVTVRALIVRGDNQGSPGSVPAVTISALVTPYAPGAGL